MIGVYQEGKFYIFFFLLNIKLLVKVFECCECEKEFIFKRKEDEVAGFYFLHYLNAVP